MIIGLIGAPGAGKDDVVAYVLQSQYGFKKFAFADQIKSCYYNEINITDEYFKSCRGTPEEQKIRKGLWEFSDKMRAEHGPMYFIDPVISAVQKNNKAVITDIRTQDELVRVVEISDLILMVVRDPMCLFDKSDEFFPETRIKIHELFNYPVFMNTYDLDQARKDFEDYYKCKGGR